MVRGESRTPGPQSPAFAVPETRKWRELRAVSLGDCGAPRDPRLAPDGRAV
jgi:hypothetical protein